MIRSIKEIIDAVLIEELKKRGYKVLGPNEPMYERLSWHRTEPVPEGIAFQDEALEQIKSQILPRHLILERSEREACSVMSAYLLIRK